MHLDLEDSTIFEIAELLDSQAGDKYTLMLLRNGDDLDNASIVQVQMLDEEDTMRYRIRNFKELFWALCIDTSYFEEHAFQLTYLDTKMGPLRIIISYLETIFTLNFYVRLSPIQVAEPGQHLSIGASKVCLCLCVCMCVIFIVYSCRTLEWSMQSHETK